MSATPLVMPDRRESLLSKLFWIFVLLAGLYYCASQFAPRSELFFQEHFSDPTAERLTRGVAIASYPARIIDYWFERPETDTFLCTGFDRSTHFYRLVEERFGHWDEVLPRDLALLEVGDRVEVQYKYEPMVEGFDTQRIQYLSVRKLPPASTSTPPAPPHPSTR